MKYAILLHNAGGGVHTFSHNLQRLLTSSEIILWEFCKSSDSHSEALKIPRVLPIKSQSKLLHHAVSEFDVIVCQSYVELQMVSARAHCKIILYIPHGLAKSYSNAADDFSENIDGLLCIQKNIIPDAVRRRNTCFDFGQLVDLGPIRKSNQNSGIEILIATNYIPAKGNYEIEQTIALLADYPHIHFSIFGKGWEYLVQLQKLSNVDISGHVEQNLLYEKMATADFLLFPSHTEGMPFTVLEAMLHEVIPVCYDLPCFQGLLDSTSAVIIKQENMIRFPILAAEEIKRIIVAKDELQTLKKNSIEIATEYCRKTQSNWQSLSNIDFSVKGKAPIILGTVENLPWIMTLVLKILLQLYREVEKKLQGI